MLLGWSKRTASFIWLEPPPHRPTVEPRPNDMWNLAASAIARSRSRCALSIDWLYHRSVKLRFKVTEIPFHIAAEYQLPIDHLTHKDARSNE